MQIQEKTAIRTLESAEDFWETRLEAIGFIFHGTLNVAKSKGQPSGASNLLHFARCPKLDKIGESETKIWFRSVRIAHKHLDELLGRSDGSGASSVSVGLLSAFSTSAEIEPSIEVKPADPSLSSGRSGPCDGCS